MPQVQAFVSFTELLRTLNSEPGTLLLFPWEEGTEPIKNVLRRTSGVRNIIVLIVLREVFP